MEDWQKNIPIDYDQNRGTTLNLHDPQVRQKLGRALLDDKANSFAIGNGNKKVAFDLGSGNTGGTSSRSDSSNPAGFNASSR
jgi:hypothetical protein